MMVKWLKCLWKLHCDYTAMTVALFSNVCKDISVLQHSCLVIIHLFIKNAIVKLREICMGTGSTFSATKVIAMYTRERGSPEANSGLSTSNLLLSYLIFDRHHDIRIMWGMYASSYHICDVKRGYVTNWILVFDRQHNLVITQKSRLLLLLNFINMMHVDCERFNMVCVTYSILFALL